MGQIVEWFQCHACGRRQRWQADLAGREVPCPCGAMVLCPDIDDKDVAPADHMPADAMDETPPDPASAPEMAPLGSQARTPFSRGLDDDLLGDDAEDLLGGDEPIALEGGDVPVTQFRRMRSRGLLGMSPFGEMLFWLGWSLLGFAAVVHAIVVQLDVYIVLAAIIAPPSWIMLYVKQRAWKRGRTLLRAIDEQLGDDGA